MIRLLIIHGEAAVPDEAARQQDEEATKEGGQSHNNVVPPVLCQQHARRHLERAGLIHSKFRHEETFKQQLEGGIISRSNVYHRRMYYVETAFDISMSL